MGAPGRCGCRYALGVGVAPSGHLLPLPHYLLHFPLPLRGQGGQGVQNLEFDVLEPIDLVLFFVSVYFLWWKPLIN